MQTQKDRQDERRVPQPNTHTLALFFSSPLSLLPAVSHHLFFPSQNPMDIWTPETCSFSLCKHTYTPTDSHLHTQTLSHPQCVPTSLLDFND